MLDVKTPNTKDVPLTFYTKALVKDIKSNETNKCIRHFKQFQSMTILPGMWKLTKPHGSDRE